MQELSGQRQFAKVMEEGCQLDQETLMYRQTESLQERCGKQVDM
ncbi:hypothetical protein KTAU_04210 [Thermogemmatispora aurantia]|uniref:Uncharacterized protein n=1 Tax=Thermogemmatispora aurantia TaxID=2045279 RepID=A0A5J4K244_9CHLR|nr:hypothetical protein KTAU_04210 [Thermogemmatispora aurantia]